MTHSQLSLIMKGLGEQLNRYQRATAFYRLDLASLYLPRFYVELCKRGRLPRG